MESAPHRGHQQGEPSASFFCSLVRACLAQLCSLATRTTVSFHPILRLLLLFDVNDAHRPDPAGAKGFRCRRRCCLEMETVYFTFGNDAPL